MSKARAASTSTAITGSTIQGIPLNDANWKTFIFVTVPDTEIPTDYIDYTSLVDGAISHLADSISTGIRQKFVCVSKSELLLWVADNVKTSDVCKDVKTALDNSSGNADAIPDSLLAKALKLRLLLLKQEGLEVLNAAKAAKEADFAAAQKADPKAADKKAPIDPKKDEKAALKSVKKDDPRDEDASKRKSKLRDRVGGKAETRTNSVNDEPLNGPEVYYMLKDFTSTALFRALAEEQDVCLSCVVRVEGSIVPPEVSQRARMDPNHSVKSASAKSVKIGTLTWKSTPNPLICGLRRLIQKAPETSSWRQTGFFDIRAKTLCSGKELFDVLASKVYRLLDQRQVHESFYVNDKIITIPGAPLFLQDVVQRRKEHKYYNYLASTMPQTPAGAAELSLIMVLEQVQRSSEMDCDDTKTGEEDSEDSLNMNILNGFIDKCLGKLIGCDAIGAAKAAEEDTERERHNYIKTFPYGDNAALLQHFVSGIKGSTIDLSESLTLLNGLSTTSVYSKATMSMIESDIHRNERILRKDQLHKSSNLDSEIMDGALRILEFEEMLGLKPGDAGLGDYCWHEYLDPSTLSQVLQETKSIFPDVKFRYSHYSGDTLIAFNGYGKVGDSEFVHSQEIKAKSKLNFGLFHFFYNSRREYLASQIEPYAYVTNDEIIYRVDKTQTNYTPGLHKIVTQEFQTFDGEGQSYTTIRNRDYCVTFTDKNCPSAQYLTTTFSDDSIFSITFKKDADLFAVPTIQLSNRSGLFVFTQADGSIVQHYPHRADTTLIDTGSKKSILAETRRCILVDGTMVKYIVDGSIHIFFPTGSSAFISSDGGKILTSREGVRKQISSAGEESRLPNLNHSIERDLYEPKTMISREDMVVINVYDSGQTITEWADGTKTVYRMGDDESTAYVKIQGEGFATIERKGTKDISIAVEDNLAYSQRLSGSGATEYRVAKDSFILDLDSDAKAKLGDILIDISKGTAILKSSRPPTSEKPPARVTGNSSLRLENLEPGQVLNTILKKSDDLVFLQNAPMLFAVRPDGSGVVFMTDLDLLDYLRQVKDNDAIDIIEEKLSEDSLIYALTLIKRLDVLQGSVSRAVKSRQLVRYSPMTRGIRERVLRDVAEYLRWRSKVEEDSTNFLIESKSDQLVTSNSDSSSLINSNKFVMGKDKAATENAILEKYKLKHEDVFRPDDMENSKAGYMRPHIFHKESSRPSTTRTTRPPSRILHKMKIEFSQPIPGYFGSPEGEEFLTNVADDVEKMAAPNNEPPTIPTRQEPKPASRGKQAAELNKPAVFSFQKPSLTTNKREQQVPQIARKTQLDTQPNERYLAVEGSARRKLHTASTALLKNGLSTFGLFEVNPSQCRFGSLKQGKKYQISLSVSNVGHDSTRFKVKGPTAGQVIKIEHRPGLVAPGMKVRIDVILNAQLGDEESQSIEDKIQIITEAEIITIPISATILKKDLFDTIAPTLKKYVVCLTPDKVEGLEDAVPFKNTGVDSFFTISTN